MVRDGKRWSIETVRSKSKNTVRYGQGDKFGRTTVKFTRPKILPNSIASSFSIASVTGIWFLTFSVCQRCKHLSKSGYLASHIRNKCFVAQKTGATAQKVCTFVQKIKNFRKLKTPLDEKRVQSHKILNKVFINLRSLVKLILRVFIQNIYLDSKRTQNFLNNEYMMSIGKWLIIICRIIAYLIKWMLSISEDWR